MLNCFSLTKKQLGKEEFLVSAAELSMPRIFSAIREIFAAQVPDRIDAGDLRAQFQKRYHCFRDLLTANNNALHAMAELEKIYYSGDSYRMADICPKISEILVNVFKMIANLREMSGGRYDELEKRFKSISKEIEGIIEGKKKQKDGAYILPLAKVSRKTRAQTGDKMAVLGELSQLDFIHVPQGFVITAAATRHFLTPGLLQEINRKLQILDPDDMASYYATCSELQHLVREAPVPEDLERQIRMAYDLLLERSPGARAFAMRSSAIGEDAPGISFAGLYTTLLNVSSDELIAAYKEVVAGKYSARAIGYRRLRGFRHEDIEMCVGCLEMVEASVSGVMYSRDPGEPGSETVRINSAPGIARGVVDGTVITDLFLMTRQKPSAYISQLGLSAEPVTCNGHQQITALTDEQLRQLADVALRLEVYFNGPQDIEWSFDAAGQLHILQSRPIAVVPLRPGSGRNENVSAPNMPVPMVSGGICASAGIACGRAFDLVSPEQGKSFPQQGVLVIDYPLPDWASLLGRAAAVLARHGSEAGHLATVAREFGIPAIFGLGERLDMIEEGQTLTIDAADTKIYDGCRQEVLNKKKVTRDLMAGSPVQRILSEALQYITPLSLTDPASFRFKASWCETLHDLTRYCHEKSVTEMFHLSKLSGQGVGYAKRLVGRAAMEWWVINLADGFKNDIAEEKKTVRIEDINSLPMLEIWRGIMAYPWSGPPPMSTRGFGAIIFQSTMRPELDPAVASNLTQKNYFLISRHFCNLSVRLGYHYAMIESYLGELLTESYITFRFKGGAADLRRKALRARLLSEVLRHYGFKVELRSDALLARVKKQPLDFLKTRLRVLGYLTLHARQLDMVMDQKQTVEQYKKKFISEIDAMNNLSRADL